MTRSRHPSVFLAILTTVVISVVAPLSRAADGDDAKRRAIHKTAEAFVAAFEKGDARAIAAFWAPDADYTDLSGRTYRGREAILKTYTDGFASGPKVRLRIEVASLKFPTPQTAVEDGTTSVIGPDGTVVARANYTNVLVEKDGKWLLSSVRESPYTPPSNRDRLMPLDWAIGVWEHDTDKGPVGVIGFDWAADGNFIESFRAVRVNGVVLENGRQTIGWDAAAKQIRSWNFESDGGFGESVWTSNGDTWTITTKSVLSSGSVMESTNIVRRVDDNTITVQTIDQKLDDKPFPNSPVMTMKRAN